MSSALFLSCEHGGNDVPEPYRAWMKGAEKVLASHRGYDIGAMDLFHRLEPLAEAAVSNKLTRLLIEFNRTEGSPHWFSAFSRELPPHLKEPLIDAYMHYRLTFRDEMRKALDESRQVLHLSVHTFTPELDGEIRELDIGLLYDPSRPQEKSFCEAWRDAIRLRAPGLRVRMNQPYKGNSDGYTRALRQHFAPSEYSGIELEVNQAFAKKNVLDADVCTVLHASLEAVLRGS